jgi:6-pyruvoyltetrahydropterin/6-carboxytetrahydropterin synthase
VRRARYAVTKVMEFCYGHRLLNHPGKCRHLHGHNGIVEIDIEADTLDALGMVVDFSEIKQKIQGWIDDNLDHKLLLCSQDPLVSFLQQMGESLYVTNENPTAENIARLIYHEARKQGFKVSEVRLWENSTSCATYSE